MRKVLNFFFERPKSFFSMLTADGLFGEAERPRERPKSFHSNVNADHFFVICFIEVANLISK